MTLAVERLETGTFHFIPMFDDVMSKALIDSQVHWCDQKICKCAFISFSGEKEKAFFRITLWCIATNNDAVFFGTPLLR